jgi:hypothetical protein
MLAFLILAVTFGLGIASGYGVRDLSSRRRRYRHRYVKSSPQPDRQAAPADHLTINLDRLLVAANDDVAMRRRQHGGRFRRRRARSALRAQPTVIGSACVGSTGSGVKGR